LEKAGLTLRQDGALVDAKGDKALMLLWHKLVAVTPNIGKRSPDNSGWGLPVVYAASPYSLSLVSAWGSWYAVYHDPTGFCKSLNGDTGADAWGPIEGGARPHTRIEYLETRVYGVHNDCSNCDSSFSEYSVGFGCFWPAVTFGRPWNYANFKDGDFHWAWLWN
jgi:hypothetical protein